MRATLNRCPSLGAGLLTALALLIAADCALAAFQHQQQMMKTTRAGSAASNSHKSFNNKHQQQENQQKHQQRQYETTTTTQFSDSTPASTTFAGFTDAPEMDADAFITTTYATTTAAADNLDATPTPTTTTSSSSSISPASSSASSRTTTSTVSIPSTQPPSAATTTIASPTTSSSQTMTTTLAATTTATSRTARENQRQQADGKLSMAASAPSHTFTKPEPTISSSSSNQLQHQPLQGKWLHFGARLKPLIAVTGHHQASSSARATSGAGDYRTEASTAAVARRQPVGGNTLSNANDDDEFGGPEADDLDNESLLYKLMQQQSFLLNPMGNWASADDASSAGNSQQLAAIISSSGKPQQRANSNGQASPRKNRVMRLLKSYSHIHQVDGAGDQIRGSRLMVSPTSRQQHNRVHPARAFDRQRRPTASGTVRTPASLQNLHRPRNDQESAESDSESRNQSGDDDDVGPADQPRNHNAPAPDAPQPGGEGSDGGGSDDDDFDCPNNGIFADNTNGCQAYHVCQSGAQVKSTFQCPLGTLFNDIILTCDFAHNVHCGGNKRSSAAPGNNHQMLAPSQLPPQLPPPAQVTPQTPRHKKQVERQLQLQRDNRRHQEQVARSQRMRQQAQLHKTWAASPSLQQLPPRQQQPQQQQQLQPTDNQVNRYVHRQQLTGRQGPRPLIIGSQLPYNAPPRGVETADTYNDDPYNRDVATAVSPVFAARDASPTEYPPQSNSSSSFGLVIEHRVPTFANATAPALPFAVSNSAAMSASSLQLVGNSPKLRARSSPPPPSPSPPAATMPTPQHHQQLTRAGNPLPASNAFQATTSTTHHVKAIDGSDPSTMLLIVRHPAPTQANGGHVMNLKVNVAPIPGPIAPPPPRPQQQQQQESPQQHVPHRVALVHQQQPNQQHKQQPVQQQNAQAHRRKAPPIRATGSQQ